FQMNRLNQIDSGLMMTKADYFNDAHLRDKLAKKSLPSVQAHHAGTTAEGSVRAFFPGEFGQGDIESLAQTLDEVKRVKEAPTARAVAGEAAREAFPQGGDAASKAYDNALKKFNDDIGKLDIFPSKKIGVDEAGEAVRREGQSLYDRLSNYADIDPRKVTEGDRLRRLESRKRELDNFFAVAFDSPSRFRQY